MLENLKEAVYTANCLLPKYALVTFTWGNVSGIDRKRGLVVIKPSGIEYGALKPEDMAVLDLEGNQVEGAFNPSSDTPTHLELYKAFPSLGGIVHTHSRWATIFAQAGKPIPLYGTTQADYFYGDIPCARTMRAEEIREDYEKNTGLVLIECLRNQGTDPLQIPGALAANHGPFVWGKNPLEAVHNAVVLEEVAMMAFHTCILSPGVSRISQALSDKHYLRKHGPEAYYGQKESAEKN
ncbi:MAG: L-ribulose-5-phosphate 4-epimerase [Spirochaetaceae bacterium]|jgi:L-ribulose-5-phosphate 4-epimerase|nr:L-ribulose-5-phosphate 4-epimerase [Spirochaetaceae bacterium]